MWRREGGRRERVSKEKEQASQSVTMIEEERKRARGSKSEERSEGGRKVARGEQKGRAPAVWEQGQKREKCQSGLNHQGETLQVEEVIRGSHMMSRKPPG